jgi:hypothetical protein
MPSDATFPRSPGVERPNPIKEDERFKRSAGRRNAIQGNVLPDGKSVATLHPKDKVHFLEASFSMG